jgi:hypothetical protein
MLAGRLDGNVRGRPVNLIAENRDLVLEVGNLRTLLTLRRSWRLTAEPLLAILRATDIRVSVQTSWLGRVEIFPKPQFFVRLMLPRSH